MNCNMLTLYFTIFIVISSFLIISIHNTVYSLLMLMVNFILSAFVLYSLNCEFLALIFLIIYVGAIMVLFLFLLMLLDIKFKSLSRSLETNYLISYLLILLSISVTVQGKGLLFYNYYTFELLSYTDWRLLINSIYNINIYSMFLCGNFVIELLIIGIVLLLVLVGIIFIINNYLSFNIKCPNSMKQASIKSKFFY
jgi:NADH-quinone oxidoreductase subunit J